MNELNTCILDGKKLAVCTDSYFGESKARDLSYISGGERFRRVAKNATDDTSFLIAKDIADVEAINLVAALRKDNADREIFLISDDSSNEFFKRASSAGASALISVFEAECYLKSLEAPEPEFSEEGLEKSIDSSTFASDEIMPKEEELAGSNCDITKTALTFSFLSGSGGVGKSTVTLLCALLCEHFGMKVCLIDLDLQFGDLKYLMGEELQEISVPFEDLSKCDLAEHFLNKSLLLLYPPSKPEMSEPLQNEIPNIIKECKKHADIVLMNTAAFWSDSHYSVMEESDIIHILMDQRASSLRGAKSASDLCVRLSIPLSKASFILNRCGSKGKLTPLDCSMVLGGHKVNCISDGGTEIDELLSMGKPRALLDSNNKLVRSLDELLRAELGRFGIECPKAKQSRRLRKSWLSRKENEDVFV